MLLSRESGTSSAGKQQLHVAYSSTAPILNGYFGSRQSSAQMAFQQNFEQFLMKQQSSAVNASPQGALQNTNAISQQGITASPNNALLHSFMSQSLNSVFKNYENYVLHEIRMENAALQEKLHQYALMEDEPGTNCTCNKEELCAAPAVDFTSPVLYLKLAAAFVLMFHSALFSGLTLGLLGLDLNSLSIVAKSDPNLRWRGYAKKIIPVRRNGNLLLCTLLLGNVSVNSLFSILTADLTSGLVGFLVSSALIVIFGEIAPQATCSRYALPIGYYTLPIVMVFMFILFPIAFPLSLVLDIVLGQELGTLYNNEGLKELLDLHAQNQGTELISDSVNIMRGAIDFSTKTVGDIMTKLDRCFMMEIQQKLDIDTLTACWQSGHSRIPVYEGSMDNVVGVLFCKDLILLNPDEGIPLRTVLTFYGREALRVFEDTHLNTMLSMFKTGRSHLAIVQHIVHPEEGDPFYKTVGLVTLEDVVEEILQTEIVDETDQYRSNEDNDVMRTHRPNINMFAGRLRAQRLTPKQVIAVSSYLAQSSKFFQMLPEEVLQQLLGKSLVVSYKKADGVHLYRKGEGSDFFTLVLSGRVEVLSGEDNFQTELGPWSFVGMRALICSSFFPDFDAKVIADTQFLQIKREDFVQAVNTTLVQEEYFFLPSELSWITDISPEVETPTAPKAESSKRAKGLAKKLNSASDSDVDSVSDRPLLEPKATKTKPPPARKPTPLNGIKKKDDEKEQMRKSVSLGNVDIAVIAERRRTRKRGASLIQLVDDSSNEPFTDPPPPKTEEDKKSYTVLDDDE
eukprot:CAMPEP_0117449788 /NCGR_PEP_ID=MMETSP0759-20121206/8124_1 /TAXON_ID=63605 /ORGANISM="Percolomonas cosmopolitus, Strain WS" /LENGTH=794 /DNA_ID=CAMNT_0005242271 /DNA_START=145 /DNA_END=2529 /DNA_ORIENTATION=-